MYPYFESIRCYNGRIYNLQYHEERMLRTRQAVYEGVGIERIRRQIKIPPNCKRGLYKCRINYGKHIGEIQLLPYQPGGIRSLQAVAIDFNYGVKEENRQLINETFQRKGKADDIIMIKDGLVTDTSYHNIVVKTKTGLYTPAQPLLQGTMRAYLLARHKITTRDLTIQDLQKSQKVFLINALNPLASVAIEPKHIYNLAK